MGYGISDNDGVQYVIFSVSHSTAQNARVYLICVIFLLSLCFVLFVRSVRVWWVVFHNAWTFNGNVSEWNVGQVTKMKYSKSYLLN